MALVGALVVALLCTEGGFKSINNNLPKHIHMKDLNYAEFIYRGMRIIAPFFLMYSIVNITIAPTQLLICFGLYGVAYLFRMLVRHLEYHI